MSFAYKREASSDCCVSTEQVSLIVYIQAYCTQRFTVNCSFTNSLFDYGTVFSCEVKTAVSQQVDVKSAVTLRSLLQTLLKF